MNNDLHNSTLFSNSSPINNRLYNNTEYIPIEKTFVENILRTNIGKKVEIYQTFQNSKEWNDKVFNGIIEKAGYDHIIISDPKTGEWYFLLMRYVDYIKFDEEINTLDQFYSNNY